MANKILSKDTVKQFTKLFIENILYERNILHKSSFTDYVFHGFELKKLKDTANNRLAKNLSIYFQGIEDAINKGYLREVIVRICRKDNSLDSLEQYNMSFTYFPDDSPKLYEVSKTASSLKQIMSNMRYWIRKYFDPLPPVSDIDFFIYIRFFDEKTPKDYIAPHFAESNHTLKTNDNHIGCSLGTFKTPFVKVKGVVEGYANYETDHELSQDRDGNGTPSIVDSQEDTILITDEEY